MDGSAQFFKASRMVKYNRKGQVGEPGCGKQRQQTVGLLNLLCTRCLQRYQTPSALVALLVSEGKSVSAVVPRCDVLHSVAKLYRLHDANSRRCAGADRGGPGQRALQAPDAGRQGGDLALRPVSNCP